VHRWSILIIVQRDATQSSLFIIQQVRSTCFGCQPHPSSQVHKTAVTVLCTPDDGCGWQTKHVERTCTKIKRLFCVASRLTTISINTLKHITSTGIRICTSYKLHRSLLGVGAPSWHLYIKYALVHIIICGILDIVAMNQIDHVTHLCMGHWQLSVVNEVCPKSNVKDLNFFYWTYMQLQFISFKIGSLWSNTAIPALLPLFTAV